MKIGLIKETKIPTDNRVALSPSHIAELKRTFPQDEFVVQSSEIRAYSDDDYRKEGISVVDNVDDCDILFGIKEADPRTLIPGKHYFFFGHIAKMQAYNRPLLQAMMAKGITFSDYEYLVDDDHQRVCAFGWWAGIVGVYYTLRGYGLKHRLFELPMPDRHFTLDTLRQAVKSVTLPAVKLLITGNGRVSHGAQYLLEDIGAVRMSEEQFLHTPSVSTLSFCSVDADRLVAHNDDGVFSWDDFLHNPAAYHSDFMRWASHTDILVCAHFWSPEAPVYLTQDNLADPTMRIRFIGDVTCDIQGSIRSTLRASTHDTPYYDYNPITGSEEPAFSSKDNISVMAVDTCPNALALDTSSYFGDMLMPHVLIPLLKREHSNIIRRATILQNGKLTPDFEYLETFAQQH